MEALRHSTTDMTLGTYAQTLGHEVGDAVVKLPTSSWEEIKKQINLPNGPLSDPGSLVSLLLDPDFSAR
jgi:hypothetical protein